METYGLIYNKDILNKYFGLSGAKAKSIDDIDSFKTLKAVADDMQARKDELGIKGAYTSAGFDSSSDWRFKTRLANLPLYYEFKEDNITSSRPPSRAPAWRTTRTSSTCTSRTPPPSRLS